MVRQIVTYPDPRLQRVSAPVRVVGEGIRLMAQDMLETMWHNGGIGLAAPQIGINKRVITLVVSENGDSIIMINPEIVDHNDVTISIEEGCLSFPGLFIQGPKRFTEIEVKALNENGDQHVSYISGMLSSVIQHEIDHLNGKLFYEHLPADEKRAIEVELVKRSLKR